MPPVADSAALSRSIWDAIGPEARAWLAERAENPSIVDAVRLLGTLAHHEAFAGRCEHTPRDEELERKVRDLDAQLAGTPDDIQHAFAWALIDRGRLGWTWTRMRVPLSVVDAHAVGPRETNTRPLVATKIYAEILSDRIIDRRGWGPA